MIHNNISTVRQGFYMRRQKCEMKNVAAGFSLRQHRRDACATNDLSD